MDNIYIYTYSMIIIVSLYVLCDVLYFYVILILLYVSICLQYTSPVG